jgi:hypothetical protein
MSRSAEHTRTDDALGRGAYGAAEALRLINFRRAAAAAQRRMSGQTVVRWLGGRDQSQALWRPDFRPIEDDDAFDVSFRDLIELRFVKAFRDAGLSLQTIRECVSRAADIAHDVRPFSTRRFRTDGKTIFFEITNGVREGELADLKRRQNVFHRIVEPSLHDLEFDADVLARWYPLGMSRKSVSSIPTGHLAAPSSATAACRQQHSGRRSKRRVPPNGWRGCTNCRSARCATPSASNSSLPLEASPHPPATAVQFFARYSAVRHASACAVSVGLWAPLVPITDPPSTPRFGTSWQRP